VCVVSAAVARVEGKRVERDGGGDARGRDAGRIDVRDAGGVERWTTGADDDAGKRENAEVCVR
jgi:hypothetical protein